MAAVCFLHIPKTSGTSVALYLESQFRATEICGAREGDEFVALGRSKLRDFSYFHAACDASVIGILPRSTAVLTMLRQPIKRAYSHWRYIQRMPDHRLHEEFQSEQSSFEQFVIQMPTNAMARLLAAPEGSSPRCLWEQTGAWDDAELLDRALARLDACAVVGLTSFHDESIAQIAHHFGWTPPGLLPTTNAAPVLTHPTAPTPSAQSVFDERNAVDNKLYGAAVTMFERRRRLVDSATRTLIYEQSLAAETAPLTRRLVIDVCNPMRGAGWLPVVDTERGMIRPIGVGGQASIDVAVTVGRFTKLEVVCPAVASTVALESLQITANGEPLMFGHRIDPEGVTLHAALPPTAADDTFIRIGFNASGGAAVPPGHTLADSDIEATLGVARIELIPYDPKSLRVAAGSEVKKQATQFTNTAQLFWRSSPTWVFDDDLRRRLDRLDLWDRVDDLQRDGFTVVRDVVSPDKIRRAREVICRLSAATTYRTQRRRVYQPLLYDQLFIELLVNPVQLALADVVCGKGLLDAQTGLVRDRTSHPQGLHAENAAWMPSPYPNHHYVCSTMLTCDDFDEANGGTCFVPGSHLTKLDPSPEDALALTGVITPEAPAGSLIVWVGGTWHGANQRMTSGERVSLLTIFTRPSLRSAQDIRGIPEAFANTEELRVRLRRSDPFEHSGDIEQRPDAMLRWIRNRPSSNDALDCGWNETVAQKRHALGVGQPTS
jgi:Phytanoyl-CoA dioxygenase (PhyH)